MVEQSGLMAWVSQYGNVVFFFAQIAYWLLVVAVAIYAVYQFKRLVDFKTGAAGPESDTDDTEDKKDADSGSEPVKIEEFVE
jgi:hypothetical protein